MLEVEMEDLVSAPHAITGSPSSSWPWLLDHAFTVIIEEWKRIRLAGQVDSQEHSAKLWRLYLSLFPFWQILHGCRTYIKLCCSITNFKLLDFEVLLLDTTLVPVVKYGAQYQGNILAKVSDSIIPRKPTTQLWPDIDRAADVEYQTLQYRQWKKIWNWHSWVTCALICWS